MFGDSERPPNHERRVLREQAPRCVTSCPPQTPCGSGASSVRVLRGLLEVLGTRALRRPEPQIRRWSVRLSCTSGLTSWGAVCWSGAQARPRPGSGYHPGRLSLTAPCSHLHSLALGQVFKCHLESPQRKGHCHASLLPLGTSRTHCLATSALTRPWPRRGWLFPQPVSGSARPVVASGSWGASVSKLESWSRGQAETWVTGGSPHSND